MSLIYATVAVERDNISPPSVLVEWEIMDRIAELEDVGVISPFHGTECRVRSGNPVWATWTTGDRQLCVMLDSAWP